MAVHNIAFLSNTDKLLKKWGFSLIDEYRVMASEAGFDLHKPVFDFATGGGRMAAALTREGLYVITGDYSTEKYEQAQLRISSTFLRHVQFLLLDMERLPFNAGSCSSIICVNTIHELSDPVRCLDELARIHRNDGKLVIADFNETGFDIMDKSQAEISGGIHGRGIMPIADAVRHMEKKGYRFKKLDLKLNYCYIAH